MATDSNRRSRLAERFADPYLAWALVALILTASLFFISLQHNHDGVTTHAIRVGKMFQERPGVVELTQDAPAYAWSKVGFDGQFFYFMAFDPLLLTPASWHALDAPRLRARRILYAWLGRLLGPGRSRIPRGLLNAQLLALLALVVMVAHVLHRERRHPALTVLFVCSLVTLVPMEYMTCEVVGGAFMVAALLAFDRERPWTGWVCAAAACLTKEVFGAAVVGLVLHALLRRRLKSAIFFASSALPLACWVLYLRLHLPSTNAAGSTLQNFDWPMFGAVRAIGADFKALFLPGQFANRLMKIYGIVWFVWGALLAWARLASRRTPSRWAAAVAACIAFLLTSGKAPAYDAMLNYARQLAVLPFALTADHLTSADSETPLQRAMFLLWLAVGFALGLAYGWLRAHNVEM